MQEENYDVNCKVLEDVAKIYPKIIEKCDSDEKLVEQIVRHYNHYYGGIDRNDDYLEEFHRILYQVLSKELVNRMIKNYGYKKVSNSYKKLKTYADAER